MVICVSVCVFTVSHFFSATLVHKLVIEAGKQVTKYIINHLYAVNSFYAGNLPDELQSYHLCT